MAFGGKVTSFTFLHASQADKPTPSFGSSAAFKAALDSQAIQLQTSLNGLIDALNSTTSGSSGAKNLGATAIPGLTGTDVQTLLESLTSTLKAVTAGSSGSEFIGSAAISGVSGATVYAQLVSLKSLIDAVFTKAQIQSTTPGSSGAEIVGSAPISGVAGTNVYAQLVDLKNQINQMILGQIPDGTITKAKLAFDPTPFGTTTGSANTYAVTLTPAPSAYTDGMLVSVKINVDSTGASTLNVNGLGAKPLKKSNGFDVTNLKANGVYTFRYNSTTGNFILQGEGGSGNATSADLLVGKTASVDSGDIVGTMPNRSGNTAALSVQYSSGSLKLLASDGYRNGVSDYVTSSDPAVVGNIKSIQSGIGTIANASTVANVSISAVDLTKSIVIVSSYGPTASTLSGSLAVRGKLTSSTNLQVTRNNSSNNITFSWTVIEFNNVKSLQTGQKVLAATSGTVTISSITPTRAVLFFSASTAANTINDYIPPLIGTITDATTLTFNTLNTSGFTIEWQVIEFY